MRIGLFQKLLGLNLGLALAVLLVGSTAFALSARRVLVQGLGEEAASLATRVADDLPASTLAPLLADPPDEAAWRSWVGRLDSIQRGLGPSGVENVYLLAPRGGGIYVAADPTGDDPPFAVADTVFPSLKQRALADGHPARTPDAYTDAWGTWISGYAPVVDGNGAVLALVGIDLPLGAFPLMRDIVQRELVFSALPAALLALVASLFVAGRVTRPARALTDGLRRVREGTYDFELDASSGDEFGQMAEAFNEMAQGLAERERVREAFAQSVSPEVAEKILAGEVRTGGEVREASVLFADIRGFTALSETLSARGVIALLNEYFDALLPCVTGAGGTVDKLVGDEIMAVFGAPVELEDDAAAAVGAALEMRAALGRFNAARPAGSSPLHFGVGISTGALVAGALGSRERRNYTVLGSAVNLGSRLCAHAGPGQILVSQATYLRTKHLFEARKLEPLTVKGITFPIHVFEIVDRKEA